MPYDADDEAELAAAEAAVSPIDRVVDHLLGPMVEAMLRMKMLKDTDVPIWELKAEGAFVAERIGPMIASLSLEEAQSVIFCALGRLAAISVRYAYLVRGEEDPA